MQKAKFLNKKQVLKKLSELASRIIIKDNNIRKIILFGSIANDTYTGTSDADLLIILKDSKLRMIDRIPDLLQHFVKAPVPVDVFPYTENEIKHIPFAQKALREGIDLTPQK
jgi:predicted nucleotidyltransferase